MNNLVLEVPVKATVITDGANLREGPSSRSAIKDALKRGDMVQLLDGEDTVGAKWLRVRVVKAYPSQVGEIWYMWGTELAIFPEPAPPDFEPPPPYREEDKPAPLPWFIAVIAALLAAALSAIAYFTK